jgi:hypothetical protein
MRHCMIAATWLVGRPRAFIELLGACLGRLRLHALQPSITPPWATLNKERRPAMLGLWLERSTLSVAAATRLRHQLPGGRQLRGVVVERDAAPTAASILPVLFPSGAVVPIVVYHGGTSDAGAIRRPRHWVCCRTSDATSATSHRTCTPADDGVERCGTGAACRCARTLLCAAATIGRIALGANVESQSGAADGAKPLRLGLTTAAV